MRKSISNKTILLGGSASLQKKTSLSYIFLSFRRASVSSTGTNLSGEATSLPQYSVDKTFADRRYKVQSARTYFYLNEATCERNMETFLECLDAVKG